MDLSFLFPGPQSPPLCRPCWESVGLQSPGSIPGQMNSLEGVPSTAQHSIHQCSVTNHQTQRESGLEISWRCLDSGGFCEEIFGHVWLIELLRKVKEVYFFFGGGVMVRNIEFWGEFLLYFCVCEPRTSK